MKEIYQAILQSDFVYHFWQMAKTKEFIIICTIIFFIVIGSKKKTKLPPGMTIDDTKWEWNAERCLWIYPIAIEVNSASTLKELKDKEYQDKVSIFLGKQNRSDSMPSCLIVETKTNRK